MKKKKTQSTAKQLLMPVSSNEKSISILAPSNPFQSFFAKKRLHTGVIFTFAFLLYANTLGHQWAHDDTVVITDNILTQKGFEGIPDIFSKDTFFGYFKVEGKSEVVSGGRYRPLTLAFFAIVYELFGNTPFPFHLLAVTLFALTCVLLYRVVLLLLRNQKLPGFTEIAAWIIAMLFAAHPIHTEAVANVKGCDEIVAVFCSLGALFLVLKAVDTGKYWYAIAGAAALWLGLLAKENAVTFLAVIPLALIFFRNTSMSQTVKLSLPLIIAFALFFAMRMAVLPQVFSKPPMELLNNPYLKWEGEKWVEFTSGEKYATIAQTLGRYIQLLVVPVTLTHDYYPRHVDIMHFSDPPVLVSFLLYAILIGVVIYSILKRKVGLIAFGILFYLITLSIVSNLVFPIGTNMGERFMFMPSIGFCFVAAGLVIRLTYGKGEIREGRISWTLGITAILLVLYSIRTITRNPAWFNNKSLAFTDVLTSVNSTKVQSFCGVITCQEGISEKDPVKKNDLLLRSVSYNTKAIEIHPTFKSALLNRGVAYQHLHQYDLSIADLRKVLNLVPDDPKGKFNLSLALGGKGKSYEHGTLDYDASLGLLNESIQLDSSNEETTWHLGMLYGRMGNYPESINWFTKFTKMRPEDPLAWGGLEWAYKLAGNQAKAAESRATADLLNQPKK